MLFAYVIQLRAHKILITKANEKGYAFKTINILFINICMQHAHFILTDCSKLVQVIAKHPLMLQQIQP